jgi:hypothetical protein
MTRTQAVSKKLGAVAAIAVGVTGLSIASPSLGAFAAPKPAVCSFESATTTSTKTNAKPEVKGAKKLLNSALSAFGIAAAGAETTACNFQLDMADWGGLTTGTIGSTGGHTELTIASAQPYASPAGVETVAYARVGCQDQQGFRITEVELTVTNVDTGEQIVLSGGGIDVIAGASYYTMLAGDVTVESHTGDIKGLTFGANENGWLVVSSATAGTFTTSFHMTIDAIV